MLVTRDVSSWLYLLIGNYDYSRGLLTYLIHNTYVLYVQEVLSVLLFKTGQDFFNRQYEYIPTYSEFVGIVTTFLFLVAVYPRLS